MEKPGRFHRRKSTIVAVLGLGSLGWFLFRTGSKPQRVTYPCQRAALGNALGALAYFGSWFGLVRLQRLLRRRSSWTPAGLLIAALLSALVMIGGRAGVPRARAASPNLPTWTSASAVSDVYAVTDVPASACSLDGGVLPASPPCDDPSYALADRGIDRLIAEMEDHGSYLHRTAGHPTGFVGSNDVVVIKINNQWLSAGSGAGKGRLTTSSDVVKGVVWRILQHPEGFAGEIVLAENTQGQPLWDHDPANATDQHQSYPDVVAAFQGLHHPVSTMTWDYLPPISGATLAGGYPAGEYINGNLSDAYILLEDPAGSGTDELSYPKFRTAGGRGVSMRYGVWDATAGTYDASRLKLINLPVLKKHWIAGATSAWKNYVGFITTNDIMGRFGGWDVMHGFFWGYLGAGDPAYGLLGRELALIRRPDLNIVDAIWVANESNYQGNAVRRDVLLASTDPFAVDWYASEYVLRPVVPAGASPWDSSAARAGLFRSATRANQASALAVWPACPYMRFLDTCDGDAPCPDEQNQMNAYVASASAPALAVGDASVTEGDSGTVSAQFKVTLIPRSDVAVTVDYATRDGTATAPSDYEPTSGSLTFDPGETTKTVDVAVNGDLVFETDETFFLDLSAPVNGAVVVRRGTATITNDDPLPSVSIDDVSITEGNAGTKKAVFTLCLSTPSGVATLVPYSTQDGTATASSDYLATAGTLTIPPGAPSGKVTVRVKGDAVIELDETFFVNLGTPTNATIADGQGQGTILNDDHSGTFSFSLANYTVSEASALAAIKVMRANGNGAATVDYAVGDGTANVGSDYNLPSGSTLTFAANQTSATFMVPIVKDATDEPNKTVLLRLSNPQPVAQGAALGAQRTAVLTIVDDDSPGKVQFSASQYKTLEGGPAAVITVKRLGGLASGVTVNYAASAGTAVDPGDFTATSGTLTFGTRGIGATTQTFQVAIGPDDLIAEGARTVLLTLSAPGGGAALGTPSSAVLTIADAESTMEFNSAVYTAKESAASALVTVKRWGPRAGLATVAYATSDGSATQSADYKPVSGTLTFLPGVSTRTFTVPILKDSLVEGAETVNLTLSSPIGASLGASNSAVLTILDDDALPTVQFSAPVYRVSEASPKAVITVKRAGNLAGTVTVDYAGAGGTATNAPVGDYDLPPGALTFGPGKSILTIPVPIVPDTTDEGTETALLTLGGTTSTWSSPGTPMILGTNPATLLITDNEPTVQFTSARFTASEALTKTNLVVRRTGSTAAPATVDYTVTGGTAANGSDYMLPVSGTLTFAPKAATALLPVALIPDKIDEPSETVIVSLSNPSAGLGLGTPEITTLTISDNDTAGKVQFGAANYSVDEGGGSVSLTVTRTLATSELASVDYQVTGGTATNGADYTLAPGTLTFNPGEKTKSLDVPVVDDALVEGNESVIVTLSNPDGGLALGALSQTTFWIVDDD